MFGLGRYPVDIRVGLTTSFGGELGLGMGWIEFMYVLS